MKSSDATRLEKNCVLFQYTPSILYCNIVSVEDNNDVGVAMLYINILMQHNPIPNIQVPTNVLLVVRESAGMEKCVRKIKSLTDTETRSRGLTYFRKPVGTRHGA